MLGAFAVGKTSLVQRYVEGIFSDSYLTTVGVKIDKKVIEVRGQSITLMLWDMVGESDYAKVRLHHLRGAAGYLLVADATRPETFDAAVSLQQRAADYIGDVPFVLAVNKVDLLSDNVSPPPLVPPGWTVQQTSAKTGDGVEALFQVLGRKMIPAPKIDRTCPLC